MVEKYFRNLSPKHSPIVEKLSGVLSENDLEKISQEDGRARYIIRSVNKNILTIMDDKRIAELQKFETKDYSDCPIQTQEQLQEFKPRPPSSPLRLCDSAPWREKNREIPSGG